LTDRALASLETIIRGAVDDVYAELNRANDRTRIARISSFVGVAEIRADPEMGDRGNERDSVRCLQV
jgi:hypothetical protein